MIQEKITEIIDERWNNVPEKLRGLLESDHVDTVLSDLSAKYKLDQDLTDKLDNCITFVILGLTHPKDFIHTVSETLGIDFAKASAIANEVNERVFRPVREELRALHGISDEKSEKPKSIDAELVENVGLRAPKPPMPPAPKPRPLDAELSESMRKPPVPPPPRSRPAPSFTPPPPPKPAPRPPEPMRPAGGVPSGEVMYRGTSNPQSSSPSNLPTQSQNPWQKPAIPQPPRPATQPNQPKPRVFENSYGEEREEDLTREQILREIENPSSVKPRPSQSFTAPIAQPPKEYNADPYREPLN